MSEANNHWRVFYRINSGDLRDRSPLAYIRALTCLSNRHGTNIPLQSAVTNAIKSCKRRQYFLNRHRA